MCSRYCLISPPEAVRSYFGYRNAAEFPPRYNIAPTEPVAVVRNGLAGERELALVRWGLIPSWVKKPEEFATLVNARAETAADKPSFRGPMRHRRCLVPADGFYEWTGPTGARRPYLIRLRKGGPMAIGGLWEHWLGADGSELETMVILTVKANAAVRAVHDRMPVIVPPEAFEDWLDCRAGSTAPIAGLLAPAPDDVLDVIEIGPLINNPRSEGPELHVPRHETGT